jgi:hypothetical protein
MYDDWLGCRTKKLEMGRAFCTCVGKNKCIDSFDGET